MTTMVRELTTTPSATPRSRNTEDRLAALGVAIADRGFTANAAQVAAVAAAGRSVAPAASTVLQDPHAPTVARERALAVVSTALLRRQRPTG